MTTDLTAHWRNLFENKYLGAWNLWSAKRGAYVTASAKISRVVRETVVMQGGRKSLETLLHFDGKHTPLVLTKKMGRVLQMMYGPVPAGWEGKTITLYVERGFRTKDGPADVLRIRNDQAGASMKDQLRGASDEDAPASVVAPEAFADDGDDPDKGP